MYLQGEFRFIMNGRHACEKLLFFKSTETIPQPMKDLVVWESVRRRRIEKKELFERECV